MFRTARLAQISAARRATNAQDAVGSVPINRDVSSAEDVGRKSRSSEIVDAPPR